MLDRLVVCEVVVVGEGGSHRRVLQKFDRGKVFFDLFFICSIELEIGCDCLFNYEIVGDMCFGGNNCDCSSILSIKVVFETILFSLF